MGIGAVLVAAAVTGSPFSLGVNAGEVVPSTAVLWAHASPGAVRVEVARDSRFDGLVFSRAARTERALPYDRWEGYEAERQKPLKFLHDNVKNVVFLTTDTHANFVNDVRFQTLEPGRPVDSAITEVVTGPVATRTFAKEIDAAVGTTSAGILISGLFFKPAPPRGVGMRCVSPDVYSYSEVSVTSSTLTVTPKDATDPSSPTSRGSRARQS